MIDPAKLIRLYDSGVLTRTDLLIRLCQAAAAHPPEEIAAAVRPDVLAWVREWSTTPPESPANCRVFHMVSSAGEFNEAKYFREESQRLYDGLRRWHSYFATA